MTDVDIQIIEFLDSLDFLLSEKFREKWRYRFSDRITRQLQDKILEALKRKRPLKLDTLYSHLTGKCRYAPEYVLNFFEAIEIEDYHPIVTGKLTKHVH